MRSLPFAPCASLLWNLHCWAVGSSTELTQDLVRDISRLDVDEPLAKDPKRSDSIGLQIAICQLQENLRAYQANELESRQPDGSPGPRFWASAKLIALRFAECARCSLVPPIVKSFEHRRLANASSVAPLEIPLVAQPWAHRNRLKRLVLNLHDQGKSRREIVAALREAGHPVRAAQVGLILGHKERSLK